MNIIALSCDAEISSKPIAAKLSKQKIREVFRVRKNHTYIFS